MIKSHPERRSAALECSIAAYGSVQAMASDLGITSSAVSHWKLVPVHHARRISKATGIPLHVLRGDVWTLTAA
jgi:DNA-binding transcriptional regulator YdaS (Cro superfamily)